MKPSLYMVLDVESVGLHGEGFAWGFVVVDGTGKELEAGYFACHPDDAKGSEAGRKWLAENCPALIVSNGFSPRTARTMFWAAWQRWKARGAILAADCPWPVEARFLSQCVEDDQPIYRGPSPDDGPRAFGGPYPLVDVASVRLAAGLDPLAKCSRLPGELPEHDPLADARQSARLLVEAIRKCRGEDRPPCGMKSHHSSCDCDGGGGDR